MSLEQNGCFESYLKKQSLTIFKTLKKRWVVLHYKMFDGYSLLCYESKEQQKKPTKIIDLNEFISIETNNTDTFKIIHHKKQDENRVFKSDDKSVLNQWIEQLTPIVSKSRDNKAYTKAKQDGLIDKNGNYQHE